MTTYDLARRLLDAGVSLIPIALDGAKRPAGDLLPREPDPHEPGRYKATWKPYQSRPATPEEARRWWRVCRPPGLAAVCGNVSLGGLELIDFDQGGECWDDWLALVAEEMPQLPRRTCAVRTPGGRHCWLCCAEQVTPGNAKLASDPSRPARGRTLVETRGEGGYALLPGCPPECHPSRGTYEHDGGPELWDLPPLSLDERDCLIRCARSFDRSPPREDAAPRGLPADDLLPGTDYDRRGPDWDVVIGAHGWKCVGGRGAERRWKRPGKDAPGWSATTGFCRGSDGADLLRVFSSNADPFEEGKAYGKFRALALLAHGGDLAACARELTRGGYGSQLRRARRRLLPADVERVLAVCREEPGMVLSVLLSWPGAKKAIEATLRGG